MTIKRSATAFNANGDIRCCVSAGGVARAVEAIRSVLPAKEAARSLNGFPPRIKDDAAEQVCALHTLRKVNGCCDDSRGRQHGDQTAAASTLSLADPA